MAQIFPNGLLPYHLVMENRKPRDILAANLNRLMEHKQLSQHGVRRLSGLTQTTVGRITRAEHGASVDTLEPLGRALGYEPWMLLYPDLDPEGPPTVGGRGKVKFSFSAAVMDRMLRLYDSLTAAQQQDELKRMETLVDTNRKLVRELSHRTGFGLSIVPVLGQPKPPPYSGKKRRR